MSTALPDKKSADGFWLKNYTVNGKSFKTRAGRLWNSLNTRTSGGVEDKCYSMAENHFKSFQEFADWCQNQVGYLSKDSRGYYWQLDKDILVPGNKIYSPETCVFVPPKLNSIFIEQENEEGLPVGVRRVKGTERFSARSRDINGVRIHLGTFATAEEARTKYLEFKASVVYQVLERYELDAKLEVTLKNRWGYGDIEAEGLIRHEEQVVVTKVVYK